MNARVIVIIEGGNVQGIWSNDKSISIDILDRDNMKDFDIEKAELKHYKELEIELKTLIYPIY